MPSAYLGYSNGSEGMCPIGEGYIGCSNCSMLGRDLVCLARSELYSVRDGLVRSLAMVSLGSSADRLWNGSKDFF